MYPTSTRYLSILFVNILTVLLAQSCQVELVEFLESPTRSRPHSVGGVVAEIFRDLQKRGRVVAGFFFVNCRNIPQIRYRARKIPREYTPRQRFSRIRQKKDFLRKNKTSIKFPQFREIFVHFRETWRSPTISGDSRKFRETWQVC